MKNRKSSDINELELSRYLDGELSPQEFEQLAAKVSCSGEHERILKHFQAVSSLVRQHSRVELTPGEQQRFEMRLARGMREITPGRLPWRRYLSFPVAAWGRWPWSWRMAAAMALTLACFIPFFTETRPRNEKVFHGPLISDYTTKIYHESNSKAHYDIIWVITEEEEENDSSNPLGLLYFYRV